MQVSFQHQAKDVFDIALREQPLASPSSALLSCLQHLPVVAATTLVQYLSM